MYKTEIEISITERDLIKFLIARQKNPDVLLKAGIFPDTCIIRTVSIDDQSKCVFRICSLSSLNTEEILSQKERSAPDQQKNDD